MWGGMCWDVWSWMCARVSPSSVQGAKHCSASRGGGCEAKLELCCCQERQFLAEGWGSWSSIPPVAAEAGGGPRAAGRVGRAAPTAPQLRISGCSTPSAVNPSRCVLAQQPQDYFLSKALKEGGEGSWISQGSALPGFPSRDPAGTRCQDQASCPSQ